jgi:hypothetical protein
MWYYACHLGPNPDWPAEKQAQYAAKLPPVIMGPACYAESDDGLTWTRPALHQVKFKGSTANNIIDLPNPVTAGIFVVKDDADPDASRRYKMVYSYYTNEPDAKDFERGGAVRSAWSADGIRWTAGPRAMVHSFIEPGSLVHHQGMFYIHGQKISAHWGAGEGGSERGRQGFAHVSPDFSNWLAAHGEGFTLADPRDPTKRSFSGEYDQVHLGVGATSFGTACIGVYGLWHNADFDKAFDKISCDFSLLISNDGLRFREPVKGHVFLAREDSPVTPTTSGVRYNTVLAQANGILNVGDETRIYHGRWRNVEYRDGRAEATEYYAEVGLATLPRDRWGALGLHSRHEAGHVWTGAIQLPAGAWSVTLNAEAADQMRVEIADERFSPIAGFSGENAGDCAQRGGLDCGVSWRGDLSRLAGRRVRLCVHMKRGASEPRLFAINML